MEKEEERVDQLERTVLELGTEIFRMKSEVFSLKEYHEKFVEIVGGLKNILDEKGLINHEDFDAAIELGNALSITTDFDPSIEAEINKLKKASH